MQRLGTTLAILVVSGGVAVAQSSGGASAGGTAGSTSGTAATPSQTGTGSATPGVSTPSPADSTTVGRAPGVNPANPQDASRRSNPSDRTLPAARNPQDLKMDGTGTPVIVAPERR
jgi:hypothetical protein